MVAYEFILPLMSICAVASRIVYAVLPLASIAFCVWKNNVNHLICLNYNHFSSIVTFIWLPVPTFAIGLTELLVFK